MSVSNNKIDYRMGKKLGVNNDGDLQEVFGSAKQQHSWYFLSAEINMWAKYKPFRHPNHTVYSDHYKGPSGQTISSARLTGARQANYGLVRPSGSETNIPADVVGQLWSYARCQDGVDPMQAWDFEGYNHIAQAPIMPMTPDNVDPIDGSMITYYSAYQSDGIDFSPIQRGTRDDTIGIADFPDVDGWYVCVLLCDNRSRRSSDSWTWKTASSPIQLNTSGGYASAVPCPVLTDGDLSRLGNKKYYYICLADTKYDDWSQNAPVTQFKPIPAGSVLDLKGVITVSTQVVSDVAILSAAFVSNPTASSYADMTQYTGTGNSYYNINGNYNVALKLRVKAPATFDITLNASDMRIALSTTFNGGSPSGLRLTMRDGSTYNQITSKTIAAGATADIYVVCSAAQALAIDATGNPALVTDEGQQLKVFFTFSHQGISFTNGHFIRLSN